MKKELFLSLLAYSLLPMAVQASEPTDTLASERNYTLNEVVVTGTRNLWDMVCQQERQEDSASGAYRGTHKC